MLLATGLSGAALTGLSACNRIEGAIDAKAAAPRPPTADEALTLVRSGHGFTAGALMAANTVYVFFDTACPHCAHLWEAAQPLLRRLKMVWIPVGLLRPQSTTQGVAILSAADPVAAMNQNEASVMARGGGIAASASPDPAILAQVKANTELWQKLGGESVPMLLYRNAATGLAGKFEGSMSTAELAALLGL
jgi:thiol:disulfide interchange protein DsbG